MKAKPIIVKPSKRLHPSGKKGAVESPDKAIAAELRAANAKKEMIKLTTIGLYSLKTSESSFGIPFAALTDALALAAAKQLLPLSNVYKVGTFCLFEGKCSALPRPVLILDNKVS